MCVLLFACACFRLYVTSEPIFSLFLLMCFQCFFRILWIYSDFEYNLIGIIVIIFTHISKFNLKRISIEENVFTQRCSLFCSIRMHSTILTHSLEIDKTSINEIAFSIWLNRTISVENGNCISTWDRETAIHFYDFIRCSGRSGFHLLPSFGMASKMSNYEPRLARSMCGYELHGRWSGILKSIESLCVFVYRYTSSFAGKPMITCDVTKRHRVCHITLAFHAFCQTQCSLTLNQKKRRHTHTQT